MAAIVPSALWFGDLKDKVSALKDNAWFQWTWFAIWAGHLTVYAYPGLTWPISLAADPTFNYIFVIWQQYAVFFCTAVEIFLVLTLYLVSYFVYETETGLAKETILKEMGIYSGFMIPVFIALFIMNRDFQYYYQTVYSAKLSDLISLKVMSGYNYFAL